jgi:spore germination protein KC
MCVVLCLTLTGCWDRVEINDLAIVDLIGVDRDPESGELTVYYQVFNPLAGSTSSGSPGQQSPVFTYEFKGKTISDIRGYINTLMSRRLFLNHYRGVIVSRRMAEQSLHELLIDIETNPATRTSVPIFVADDPVSDIMNTFAVLERIPGEALELQVRSATHLSLLFTREFRIKDLSERMLEGTAIAVPMVHLAQGNPITKSSDRSSMIQANYGNDQLKDGAVIKNFRMVGKLSNRKMVWLDLLSGSKSLHSMTMKVDGEDVQFTMRQVRNKIQVDYRNGKPVVTIRLDLQVSTGLSLNLNPTTYEEMLEREESLRRALTGKLYAFWHEIQDKEWDLLSFKTLIKTQLPKAAPTILADEHYLKNVELVLHVDTNYVRTGNLQKKY